MKKRMVRYTDNWMLSVITKTGIDGCEVYYVIGERQGEKFWFYKTKRHKDAVGLMRTMDPDKVLRAAFPSGLRRFPYR